LLDVHRQPEQQGSLISLLPAWRAVLQSTICDRAARQYHDTVRRFLWAAGLRRPDEITAGVVQDYVARLHTIDHCAPSTIHRACSAISSFCRYLWQRGMLEDNPCRRVTLPRIPAPEISYLEPDQVSRVLRVAAYYGIYYEIKVAIYTGLRKTELRLLRWEQINLEGRIVRLTRTKNNKHRTVPLAAILVDDLAAVAQDAGYVWPGARPDSPRSDTKWGYMLVPLQQRMPEITGWHIFRKTFASRLIQEGVSPAKVAAWLGHSDIKLTLSTYGSLAPDRFDADIDRLGGGDD